MNEVYKENYELKQRIKDMELAFSDILSHIYCIGGQLNDNIRRYTKDQLKPFWSIAKICSNYERTCCDE